MSETYSMETSDEAAGRRMEVLKAEFPAFAAGAKACGVTAAEVADAWNLIRVSRGTS